MMSFHSPFFGTRLNSFFNYLTRARVRKFIKVWKKYPKQFEKKTFLTSLELPSPFPWGVWGGPGRFSSSEEASGLLAKDVIGVLFEGEKIFWGEDASFV